MTAGSTTRLVAATAYPEATLPGMGLAKFSEFVRASCEELVVECAYDTPMDGPSLLAAIEAGEIQIADLYCGALAGVDSVFQVASLPFHSTTPAAALQLLAAARPEYARAFAQRGAQLLYVSPWPPTGLWSRCPIGCASTWSRMRIRTYDQMSADVLRGAGGNTTSMTFGEACLALQEERLDGVLSSGDGAAGQRLGGHLRYFYDLRYAMPISFAVMNFALYRGLPAPWRCKVDYAAANAERTLWSELHRRMLSNRAGMLGAGIQVIDGLIGDVRRAIMDSARITVGRWERTVPSAVSSIPSAYFPSPQGR